MIECPFWVGFCFVTSLKQSEDKEDKAMDPIQKQLTVSFTEKLRIVHDVETGWDNRLKVGGFAYIRIILSHFSLCLHVVPLLSLKMHSDTHSVLVLGLKMHSDSHSVLVLGLLFCCRLLVSFF